jgi:hypothetical protein
MFLGDALSQLAIWGATSIALCDGWIVPFAEADELLAQIARGKRFSLWPADECRGSQQMMPSSSTGDVSVAR